jgi:hypothetical protein
MLPEFQVLGFELKGVEDGAWIAVMDIKFVSKIIKAGERANLIHS